MMDAKAKALAEELLAMERDGTIERRRRPDGQLGYYLTRKGEGERLQ